MMICCTGEYGDAAVLIYCVFCSKMHQGASVSTHILVPTEKHSRGAHECIMNSLQDLARTRTTVSARVCFPELDLLDLRIAPVASAAVCVG